MTARLLVALVGIPIVVMPLLLGGFWFASLVYVIALAGGFELYGLLRKGGYVPLRWLGLFWLGLLVLDRWQSELLPLSTLIAGGLVVFLIFALFTRDNPIGSWMSTTLGALYVGLTLGQAVPLRLLPDGLWWLLFAIFVTWSNDSFAYFAGSTVGRHQLWARVSPSKTWEGTVAGWGGAVLMALLFVWLTPLTLPLWLAALLGAVSGVLALLGDLSISMFKRQARVKNSGNLLPGHGGVLDRLDSLLFVMPFIYQSALLWLAWAG